MKDKIKALALASAPIYLMVLMQGLAAAGVLLFITLPHVAEFPAGMNYEEFTQFMWSILLRTSSIAKISCVYATFAIWFFKHWRNKIDNDSVTYFTIHNSLLLMIKLVISLILLAVAFQIISEVVISALYSVMPKASEDYQQLLENSGLTGKVSFLLGLYTVLLGPIAEEFAFRGVSLSILEKQFDFVVANILQALFFGFVHLNLIQGIYAFGVGLFVGYIVHLTGSIVPSILFHITFNAAGLVVPDMIAGKSFQYITFLLIISMFIITLEIKQLRYVTAKTEEVTSNEQRSDSTNE